MIADKVDNEFGERYNSGRSGRSPKKLAKSSMPNHFLSIKIEF